MNEIKKPINRSKIRQILGKEYFILKRKFEWFLGNKKWAETRQSNYLENPVFKHKSMILRPLKNVDMYLQENKRTNLKIAISKINRVIIKLGQTFSIWKLVGRPTKRKGYLEGLILNQGEIGITKCL